jgi:hypothetical protein
MNQRERLTKAKDHIQKAWDLLYGNQFSGFFSNHLIQVKFELERQLAAIKDK